MLLVSVAVEYPLSLQKQATPRQEQMLVEGSAGTSWEVGQVTLTWSPVAGSQPKSAGYGTPVTEEADTGIWENRQVSQPRKETISGQNLRVVHQFC